MSKPARIAFTAAAVGGGAWAVKAAIITVKDGSFNPAESVFFLGGLLGILSAGVLLAWTAAARAPIAARVAFAALGLFAGFAATFAVETFSKDLIAGLAAGDNLGLEEESGIFTAGLLWFILGLTGLMRDTSRTGLAVPEHAR